MILSNRRIHQALDEGWIVIDPEPSPRFVTNGQTCPYQTSSVDLRLGSEIAWLREGLPISVDLGRGGFADLFGPNSESTTITDHQPFVLKPGRFVLGKTLERLSFPIKDGTPCFAAMIEGRSSYARAGLMVHFTAPTIHAGYSGAITLEMMNLGQYDIILRPGGYVCQLIIETVDGVPFPNASQFQGQTRPGGIVR